MTTSQSVPGIGHNQTHNNPKDFADLLRDVREFARQEAKGKITRAEFGKEIVQMASEHLISMANKGHHGKEIHAEWKRAYDDYTGKHSEYSPSSKSNAVQVAKINILIKCGVNSAVDANDLMERTRKLRQTCGSKLSPYDAMCAIAALQVKNPRAALSDADITNRLTPKQKTKEELASYKTLLKSMERVAYGTEDDNGQTKDVFKSTALLESIKLIEGHIANLEVKQAEEERAVSDAAIAAKRAIAAAHNTRLIRNGEEIPQPAPKGWEQVEGGEEITADTEDEDISDEDLDLLTAPGPLDLQQAA